MKLQRFPASGGSAIVLAGATNQKELLLTVARKGGDSRSTLIPLAADGSFNVRYFIKDGPGTYALTFFGSEQIGSKKYQGLGYFDFLVTSMAPPDLPGLELNSRVIEFVDKALGTTVGRGECWDLAQEALDRNLADWTRPTRFGLPLDPETDEIRPGDIIQFRSLKITEELPGQGTRRQTVGSPDHTAVVYKVHGKKRYTLAHQNVNGNRAVVKSDIDLTKATGGKYWIYRPVALMVRQ